MRNKSVVWAWAHVSFGTIMLSFWGTELRWLGERRERGVEALSTAIFRKELAAATNAHQTEASNSEVRHILGVL